MASQTTLAVRQVWLRARHKKWGKIYLELEYWPSLQLSSHSTSFQIFSNLIYIFHRVNKAFSCELIHLHLVIFVVSTRISGFGPYLLPCWPSTATCASTDTWSDASAPKLTVLLTKCHKWGTKFFRNPLILSLVIRMWIFGNTEN